MTTRLQINVNADGLLDRNFQQQLANRLAYQTQASAEKAAARGEEQRRQDEITQGRNPVTGRPFGSASRLTRIDQEPAAFRGGQGLNLGHLWLFGDIYRRTRSTGILSAQFGGRSFTLTNDLRGSQYDLLLGCGNGKQWRVFPNIGADPAPLLPADTFSVDTITPRILQPFVSPPSADSSFVGRRRGGSIVDDNSRFFQVALPCGGGNFIYIYGFTSIWNAYEAEASYAAYGRFTQTDPDQDMDEWPFMAYQNPTTGLFNLQEIPDSLGIIGFVNGSLQPVSFTGYRSKKRQFAAFVCNNFAIRPIEIPSELQLLFDGACPEAIEATRTVYIYNSGNPDGAFVHNIYRIPDPTFSAFGSEGLTTGASFSAFGSEGLTTGASSSAVYTPDVFRIINNNISFTDPANIKTFPESLRWGFADYRDGSWAIFQDTSTQPSFPWFSNLYREGLPFHYALWPNKDQQPDFKIWDPNYASDWQNFPKPKRINKATLNLSDNRVPREGANDSENSYGPQYYNSEQLVTVWDWDDPGYCRAMCKALGFSNSDLTP